MLQLPSVHTAYLTTVERHMMANRALLFRLIGCIALITFTCSSGAQTTELTPRKAFNGHSEGQGTLKFLFGTERTFHVVSDGHDQADGSFRLDQSVTFAGEPTQTRFWIVHDADSNPFTATLSDASGLVTGHVNGSRMELSYRIKGPLVMQQTLKLSADGASIDNEGRITVLGIPIGYLHETISAGEKSASQ